MLSYFSSWFYQEDLKDHTAATPVVAAGLARYANPENPTAPASFISELASVKLRHVQTPARPTFFPPRHPVLQQILLRRRRYE
jgi:hypothetical protein